MVKNTGKYDTIIWSAREGSSEEDSGEAFLLSRLGYGYQPISDDNIDNFLRRLGNNEPLWFALYVGGKEGIKWFGKIDAIIPEKFARERTEDDTKKGKTYYIKLEYVSSLPQPVKYKKGKKSFITTEYTTFASLLRAKDTSELE